jgi:hypothetical protein
MRQPESEMTSAAEMYKVYSILITMPETVQLHICDCEEDSI